MESLIFTAKPGMLASLPYAAYGSNLFHKQMKERVGAARFLGTGFIPGMKLVFAKHASIDDEPAAQVPVGLWRLDEDQVRKLDRFEGFPNVYIKTLVKVVRQAGTEHENKVIAFTYVMRSLVRISPAKEYVRRIAKGYDDCGLDKAYLSEALRDFDKADKELAGLEYHLEPEAVDHQHQSTRYVSRNLLDLEPLAPVYMARRPRRRKK